MIHDLKPYPAYKDSGVPWLGRIPEHWDLRRTKTLLRERVQKGFPDEPLLAATQTKGVVRKEQYENRTVVALKDLHLLKLVHVGDFVISLRSFQGGIESARDRGIISSAYTILYPVQAETQRFLERLFKSKPYIENLTLFVTGIRQGQNIDYEKLSRSELPIPPGPEQSAIVRFLDHADRRIRRYIHAKKKLIALLNEQRQAIIHCAVTRGLNPNVRLKPLGVEWLGEVPEHWEVKPLKRLLTRMDYGTSENLGREGNIRVLTMGHIKEGEIVLPTHGSLGSVPEGLLLEKHDLLFNRTNSPDLVGKVGIFRGTADDTITFASYLVRLRTKKGHDPNWLNCLLNSTRFWAYARSQAYISLHQANLNSTRYGQMLLPVPLGPEQIQIAEYLGACLQGLDEAANAARMAIDLLHEYRTRLIADVVTGKLDVREAAARLPDEVEEAEPLDESEAMGEDEAEGEGVDLDALSEEAIA